MARGSGTSLSGGAVPIEDGIVIALNRMNRVLRFDPEPRVAVVEPGVVNLAVTALGAPHGLYYAPDPSSQSVCTIGGNVAFNSGGAHCFRHGMTANHVLGMRGRARRRHGGGARRRQPRAGGAGSRPGCSSGRKDCSASRSRSRCGSCARPAVYRTVLAAYDSPAGRRRRRVARDRVRPAARRDGDHGPPRDRRRRSRRPGRTIRAGAAAVLIVELRGRGRAGGRRVRPS